MRAGLDPYFGVMHGAQRDQGSLVFDLIEELRAPFADRVVVALVGRRFRPRCTPHGRLGRASCARLVAAFHRTWTRPQRWRSEPIAPSAIADRQAASFARLILGDGRYAPYRMHW